MTISIAVVEDNKAFRASLVQLINSTDGFRVLGEFSNAEEAAALLHLKPDVVIVDIVLPGKSGVELIQEIKAQQEGIQFLVCSSYDDDERIFSALKAGASGYIMKDYSSAEIIAAVHELYQGGSPMTPYIARRVINSFQQKKEEAGALLTEREREILRFAAQGLIYKEIADELAISHQTVKRHLRNIYQKLQVQNKIEAINKLKS